MDLPRPPFQPIVKDDEVYVEFTQYLLPDGRKRAVGVTMPIEFKPKVERILETGAVFECEILQTGHVSLTINIEQINGDVEPLAHEISDNGPEIDAALVRLINRAYELATAF